jgi:glycosyltransferase involved in cell wall biosynthesis
MFKKPKISFVLATYQGERTIKKCLDSIFFQDYPKSLMEVLILDGGSKDKTLEIAKNYDVKIFNNLKKYSEGEGMGKAQGFEKSSGDIIIFIDQDNVFLSKDCVNNLIKPLFMDKEICVVGSKISIVKDDNIVNKYLSIVGTDPFMAPFSIDGQVSLNKNKFKKIDNFLVLQMNKDKWYIAGSNGYAYRKEDIKKIGGYSQDSDVIYKFANLNKKLVISLGSPLHHINITKGFLEFIKKRNSHFKYFVKENSINRNVKYVPSNMNGKLKIITHYLKNLIIIPNLAISIKNSIKDKEILWLLHPFMAFINLIIYTKIMFFSKEGLSYIKNNFL